MTVLFERVRSLALSIAVVSWLTANPVQADVGADSVAGQDLTHQLAEGQRLLTLGAYDEAIGLLKEAVEGARPESLQEAYLLLIKAYVVAGNYHRFRAKGAVTSELYYQKAEDLILQCLRTESLRHTTPEPAEQYPPEMVAAFQRVRSAHFGALRVIGLEPPNVTIRLDGELVPHAAPSSLPEVRDLAAGLHEIVVRADGFEDWKEQIDVAAGSTLERAYALEKRKGIWWWTTRVGGAVAAGTVVAVVAANRGGGGESPTPLPGPPDPPP